MATTTTTTGTPTFSANERVLCFHGPLLYEAKILRTRLVGDPPPPGHVSGPQYFVHYKGWKQTWDEWVPPARLLKITDENLAKQKQFQQQQGGVGHTGTGVGISSKAGGSKSGSGGIKDSASTRAGGRKDGSRGTKRAREDDDSSRRPEMKLNIPEVLKARLVDDWEAVTKNNQIIRVPREPNVKQVLAEFADHVRTTEPTNLRESKLLIQTVVDGLQTYFDRSLGTTLLYRFERIQYATVRRTYITGQHVVVGQDEKEMSEVYGAEHLLRMLVNLPQMISQTVLDNESVNLIRDYANELMVWMVQEQDRIFMKQYDNADLNYQNLSRS